MAETKETAGLTPSDKTEVEEKETQRRKEAEGKEAQRRKEAAKAFANAQYTATVAATVAATLEERIKIAAMTTGARATVIGGCTSHSAHGIETHADTRMNNID
jgi:hypothetical protein